MSESPTSLVVTGMGLCTPLGPSIDESWAALTAGRSAIAPVRQLVPAANGCRVAAECTAASAAPAMRVPKHAKYAGRAVACALHAVGEAWRSARLPDAGIDPYRVAVYSATGQTGLDVEQFFAALTATGESDGGLALARLGGRAARLVDPYFSLRTLANGGLALVAMELDARGPSSNHAQGELAGVHALAEAMWDLEEDRADVAVVFSCDSLLGPSTWLAYERCGLLSHHDPARALAPFDRARDGIALGEGGAALVIERAAHARERGAAVLARVLGAFVEAGDPPTPWSTSSRALTRVLGSALATSLLASSRATFLVARGLGTRSHDAAEASALARCLGRDRPVTAVKGATGYLGAASALVEAAIGITLMQRGSVPAIVHLEDPDAPPELTLARTPRRLDCKVGCAVLTLSAGWDGSWGAIALAREGQALAHREVEFDGDATLSPRRR